LGSADVDPATGGTVQVGSQFVAIVPAGAVDVPARLVVTGGSALAPTMPWTPVVSYEVMLVVNGQPVQPARPITLRFRVFPAALPAGVPAEDRLVATTLPQGETEWREMPFKIETDAEGVAWMTVETPHLTSFAQWLLSGGWTVLSVPGWRIFFDPGQNAAGFGAKTMEELAVAYRGILDSAFAAYVSAGFPSPRDPPTSWAKVSVYLVPMPDDGAYYNALTGNIVVNSLVASDNEARDEAQHELFHLFQNAVLNMKSMDLRRWFVEAAATYAADRVAPATGELAKKMRTDFFRTRVDVVNEKHEYAAGNLLDWAVRGGANLKDLQDAVFAADALTGDPLAAFGAGLAAAVPACQGPLGGFADSYLCFASWAMFDAARPLPTATASEWADATSTLSEVAPAKVDFQILAWKAYVWATIVPSAGGPRPVRLVLEPTENSDCRFKAFHVPGNDPSRAVELADDSSPEELAFERADVADGDAIVLIATTPVHCDAHAELRDLAFCKFGRQTAGLVYECEDLQGLHIAEPSYCDGNKPMYVTWECAGRACVEWVWGAYSCDPGDCCGMYGEEGVPKLPGCGPC